jgi:hypothetical protein
MYSFSASLFQAIYVTVSQEQENEAKMLQTVDENFQFW